MLPYCQSKQDHIDLIKETVRCLVQVYLSNQARTRLDRLLTDSSQYFKSLSENTFSGLVILLKVLRSVMRTFN